MITFEVMLLDGHSSIGEERFNARKLSEAVAKAEAWAKDGDWDHPGTVTLNINCGRNLKYTDEIEVGETA